MKNAIVVTIILGSFWAFSCRNSEKKSICQYKISQLLSVDTPKAIIVYQNDSLVAVQDNSRDSLYYGLYTFDKAGRLRFYGFFLNEDRYCYAETYDSCGHVIEEEGSPLLGYRIWKKSEDSVLFNASLFALNKKYEGIELVTNMGDTIRPKYLYKSDFYTNVKCFPFKLGCAKEIDRLIIYARGIVRNTCTGISNSFSDTALFTNTKL